jgi:hypothetical protein
MKLLSINNNKTLKGEKVGYRTHIMHLSPSDRSGYQTCPKASDGCKEVCLNVSGHGYSQRVQDARINKTRYFFEHREAFMHQLVTEIKSRIKSAVKNNMIPAFRLNGTSDIAWEKIRCVKDGIEYRNVMEAFPDVQFYDYTKIAGRKDLPSNYHVTFSRAENNDLDVRLAMSNNMNIAVVFKSLPEVYLNRKVINGDLTDLRFLDQRNVVVGVKAKGHAKHDNSGFVISC